MSKHTTGPWRVAHTDKNGQSVIMNEHIEIATCWHHSVSSIEREMHHNARLIAAAPELLEALKRARDWFESQAKVVNKGCRSSFELMMLRDERDAAQAAIAKAEGESNE